MGAIPDTSVYAASPLCTHIATTMCPVRSDKVKAVRISSKRSMPSVAPVASGSTPADWLQSALDIARWAAMADDLAHADWLFLLPTGALLAETNPAP